MNDSGSAGADDPDASVVFPTVQIAAAPVLSDEGDQGVEHVRHGAGRVAQLPKTNSLDPDAPTQGSRSSLLGKRCPCHRIRCGYSWALGTYQTVQLGARPLLLWV